MRQSRGRGSKVETEARPCEAEARPSQLKKTASRPPRAELDASRTPSLVISRATLTYKTVKTKTKMPPKLKVKLK